METNNQQLDTYNQNLNTNPQILTKSYLLNSSIVVQQQQNNGGNEYQQQQQYQYNEGNQYQQQQNPYQQPIFGQPVYMQTGQPFVHPTFGNPMQDDEIALNTNGIGIQLQKYSEVPTTRLCEQLKCGSCSEIVISEIKFFTGTGTWLVGIGLCLILFWPCSCIPCYTDTCKDVYHYCPKCKVLMGVKKYLID